MQQNILEPNPDASLRVYVVWLEVLGGDSRSEWPADLLADERVTHLWDESRATSDWAQGKGGLDAPIVYDAYLVYGGDAAWGDEPRAAGRPIIGDTARLERSLEPLLG